MFGSQSAERKGRFEEINPTSIDTKWATYQMIHTLIKETNNNETEVYGMNYIHSLNWLSYLKNVNDVQNNINKKQ